MKAYTVAQADPINSIVNGVTFAYQWGSTVIVFVAAAMLAISLIAWMIHR